jgi:hypothetical protein
MANEVYTDLENLNSEPPVDEIPEASLFNFVFHYNYHTKLWNAIPRESYMQYWSSISDNTILKSRSFNTLVDIIQRTSGNMALIDQLTREQ